MSKNKKYYVVAKGKKRGIFTNWSDCYELTNGYGNNLFKSFSYFEDAQDFLFEETGIWIEEYEINKRI